VPDPVVPEPVVPEPVVPEPLRVPPLRVPPVPLVPPVPPVPPRPAAFQLPLSDEVVAPLPLMSDPEDDESPTPAPVVVESPDMLF
jgi:hypothetical protein